MRAIHYTCFLGNTRSIYQYLIFPEFKVEWSMDYNTDHSGIKDRRDLFEARYNDFLENIDLAEISLRFPVEFLKETPETFLEILINPETTPNFGIYLEMKLLKQFNLI